jgi:hypothetical protein
VRTLSRIVPAVVVILALASACGGGSKDTPPAPPPQATGLGYVDPAGTGWRLVKDSSSTPTRVVLNLVGPSGLMSRGAGFNLQAPAAVRFGGFPVTGLPIQSGGVYQLKKVVQPTGDPLEPELMGGGVKPGNLLTVAIFQKDRRASPKDSGSTLFQIALEFDASAGLSVGDPLPLRIAKSKYMAEDIGAYASSPTAEMRAKSVLHDITIAVGTLTAN